MTSKPKVAIWPLRKLKENPLNLLVRGAAIDPKDPSVLDLAESIRQTGLLQAFTITPDGTIIAGHRRRVACQLAGLTEVPVSVKKEMAEADQLTAMLSENLQRKDLSPGRTALVCADLRKRNVPIETIAGQTGLSVSTVKQFLVLAGFPEALRAAFVPGVPLGYVEPLALLKTDRQRLEIGLKAIRNHYRVQEVKGAVTAELEGRPVGFTSDQKIRPPSNRPLEAPRMVELLNELTIGVQRNQLLARDPTIWEWCERFMKAVAAARK